MMIQEGPILIHLPPNDINCAGCTRKFTKIDSDTLINEKTQ